MYRVLNLVDDDNVQEAVKRYLGDSPIEDTPHDVLLFDKQTIGIIDITTQKNAFMICVLDDKSELSLFPFTPNAWIYRHKIDQLGDLVKAGKKELDAYQQWRIMREVAGTIGVHLAVHEQNIGMIRDGMRGSAGEIKDIFEAQVQQMRTIHTDISKTSQRLEEITNQNIKEITTDEVLESTKDILARTDQVIKAMFGFVSILQCEDRITQMLDGICSVMKIDIEEIISLDAAIGSEEKRREIKRDLIRHYTIQEQRDFAGGIPVNYSGCRTSSPDIEEEFTLF